jgi:TrmH family RNA methyltransferase
VRDGRVDDRIFVEGLRLAEDAVRSNVRVETCLLSSGAASSRRDVFVSSIADSEIDVIEVSDQLFSSITETKNSQGIVLICARPAEDKTVFEKNLNSRERIVPVLVLLSEVSNPSNLGAVIRSAEAAGALGVIVSKDSADAFSAKALRAAMGAAFRIPIWQGPRVGEVIDFARQKGFEVAATAGSGDVSYLDVDWKKPRLLVLGSEAHGLSDEILETADTIIKVPMEPNVESLNLAVSAGVILFEARRQISTATR